MYAEWTKGCNLTASRSSSLGLLDSPPSTSKVSLRHEAAPSAYSVPTQPPRPPRPSGPPWAPQAPCLLAGPRRSHQLSDSEAAPAQNALPDVAVAGSLYSGLSDATSSGSDVTPCPLTPIPPACYSCLPMPVFCMFTAASSVSRIVPNTQQKSSANIRWAKNQVQIGKHSNDGDCCEVVLKKLRRQTPNNKDT